MQRDNINHYVAKSEIIVRKEVRFYTRETNSAAFCAKQCMSFKSPFPSMQLK